ncbi:MAG: DUF2911 domain-containing protein [Balneolales bacterium]
MKTLLLFSILFATYSLNAQAQEAPEQRASPVAIEHITIDDTYIKVVYGQPHKLDRVIFGDLVPYNEVWRAGANEATEITLTGDIEIGGQQLEAGTYSLFAIPSEDQWTMIVSNQLGEWGAFTYDDSKDVLRFDVPVTNRDTVAEAFTISFTEDGSALNMMWDKTAVSVPVKVN